MTCRNIVVILSVAALVSLEAMAGDRSNPRGMGMARTVNATARQFDALGINPALLGMRGRGNLSVGLAKVGLGLSSDFLSYDIYNDYFTGTLDGSGEIVPTYLTDADKERILAEFPDDIGTFMADGEAGFLGFSLTIDGVGGFGFSAADHLGGKALIAKDYARFALYGLDSLGSTYLFDGSGIGGWWWREYNLSFGMQIPLRSSKIRQLYGGIGVKLVHGFGVAETVNSHGLLANERVEINQYIARLELDYLVRRARSSDLSEEDTDVPFFPAPAGSGFGLDLGVAVDIDGVLATLSITDIGSISWSGNLTETYSSYSGVITDPFNEATQDSIESAIEGQVRPGSAFSTSLPTRLRIGFSFHSDSVRALRGFPRGLLLAFDYTQGLTSSLNNTVTPRFSLGVEYRPIYFLPLRTGVSVGGGTNVRWAAGFGLDFHYASLDVGVENVLLFFTPTEYDMLSLGAGLTFRL